MNDMIDTLISSSSPYLIDENNSPKFTIVHREGYGRVVIATECITELGTIVMREKPLLVWTDGNCDELLDSFLESSDEVKGLVLDMYVPDNKSKLMQKASMCGLAVQYSHYSRFTELGRELVAKLIGIALTNSHSYSGKIANAYRENMTGQSDPDDGKSALFAIASKVAHSCLPNVTYSSRTCDGCLEYRVIRPIMENEMICFPYIDNLFETPTYTRRQILLDTKEFICHCNRCDGPDFCRLIRCSTSTCRELIPCMYNVPTEMLSHMPEVNNSIGFNNKECNQWNYQWNCSKCGVLDSTLFLLQEKKYDRLLTSIQSSLNNGDMEGDATQVLDTILSNIQRDLSPNHFLILRTLRMQSQTCAGHAHQIQTLVNMGLTAMMIPLIEYRLKAANAGFHYVSKTECIAACCVDERCPGSCHHQTDITESPHGPVLECSNMVLFAWKDVQLVPKSQWPCYIICMMRRYLPLFKIYYSRDDDDVKEIELMIDKHDKAEPNDGEEKKKLENKTKQARRSNKKKRGKKR